MRRIWKSLKTRPRAALRTAAALCALGLLLWTWFSLRPDTWRYYTDEVSFRTAARDAVPEPVIWENASALHTAPWAADEIREPALSADGRTLVFSRGRADGNSDLFFSRWNGAEWNAAQPARALNSAFHERGAAFSHDGAFLYFATDRPGGPGGFDIWVSRWDGSEFAWPVPLSLVVNSPYDELGPAPADRSGKLYFCSDRPREAPHTGTQGSLASHAPGDPADFDIFVSDRIPAGVTNRSVERATSMLYYLREAALNDAETMTKLGGSKDSEVAVDRALKWLKGAQDEDGRWNLARHGGGGGHDVGATSLALLALFGHGERHDQPGPYQDCVSRGLAWLVTQQKPLGGLLGTGNFYDHGFASLALGEAYGLSKDEALYDAAQSAINYTVDQQHEDGGWRYNPVEEASDLSVTGWQVMALRNAELSGLAVPRRTFDGIRRYLKTVGVGTHGGIYGYQAGGSQQTPTMLATGAFCAQLMGLSPNTERAIETALRIAQNGVKAEDRYYTYYATLAANQNQGPLWRMWRETLREALLETQDATGTWQPGGAHSGRMGAVVATAFSALSLQAHYRYTPMYGLGYEPDSNATVRAAIEQQELPKVPEYRRAKRLRRVSSKGHDMHPVATAHGDFLYFSSDRAGGRGGLDVYRSRISGSHATAAKNVGSGINSAANEEAPAIGMHGFYLLVSADRGADAAPPYRLHHSISRRVRTEINDSTRPSVVWVATHYPAQSTLIALALLALLYWALTLRHIRQRPLPARAGRWLRLRRMLRILGPLLLALLAIAGARASIHAGLRGGLWLEYTDGHGLRRSALDESARRVLWNTRRAPGRLPAFSRPVAPAFSADETQFSFTMETPGETQALHYVSSRKGHAWSRPRAAPPPPHPSNTPPATIRSGGTLYTDTGTNSAAGHADIVRRVDGETTVPENLGPQVNSARDDLAPTARSRGFDLLFCSSRGSDSPPLFRLHTATAREVVGRVDYTRWHRFTAMLGRIKWWIAALAAAAAVLLYLLRHWKDITDLRHKCLLASLGLHMLALLIMASWIISAEMIESVDAQTGDAALNVDNLAAEKLALDLEAELTELPEIADALTAERQDAEVALPAFTPSPVADTPPVATEAQERSFVANTETVHTETPETDVARPTPLDLLPDLEMPDLLQAERFEERAPEPPQESAAPHRPEIAQERLEVERREWEAPVTEAQIVDSGAELAPSTEADSAALAQPVAASASAAPSHLPPPEDLAPAELPQIDVPAAVESLELAQQPSDPQAAEASDAPTMEQETLSVKPLAPQVGSSAPNAAHLKPEAIPTSVATNASPIALTAQARTSTETVTDRAVAPARMPALADAHPSAVASATQEPLEERVASEPSAAAVPASTGLQTPLTVAQRATATPASAARRLPTASVVVQTRPQSRRLMPVDGARAELPPSPLSPLRNAKAQIPPQQIASVPTPTLESSPPGATTPAAVPDATGGVPEITSGQPGPSTLARRASTTLPRADRASTRPATVAVSDTTLADRPRPRAQSALRRASVESASPGPEITTRAAVLPPMALSAPTALMEAPAGAGERARPRPATPPSTLATAEMQNDVPVRKAPSIGARPSPIAAAHAEVETVAVDRPGPRNRALSTEAASTRLLPPGPPRATVAATPLPNGTIAPALSLSVHAPGELEVLAATGRGTLPEVLRNPSELSDDVVESLGGNADTQASIASALDWFTRNQERNGRWDIVRHGGGAGHNVGASALTLLCYYGWGARHNEEGPHQEAVQRGLAWLVSQVRKDGDMRGWIRRRYEDDILLGNMYDHAIGTIALCEAYALTRDPALRNPAERAIAFLVRAQHPEGGSWRYAPQSGSDTSVLGWSYMALKSAELSGIDVPKNVFAEMNRWLGSVAGGRAGGLYGYQSTDARRPAMIATGMFCRRLGGAGAGDPNMQESAEYIATHPLETDSVDYYYLYYGTLALFQHGGPEWEGWNTHIKTVLPARQHKTGKLKGSWDPEHWSAGQMGRVVSTAISTLSLEVYYRLLPIYTFETEEEVWHPADAQAPER